MARNKKGNFIVKNRSIETVHNVSEKMNMSRGFKAE